MENWDGFDGTMTYDWTAWDVLRRLHGLNVHDIDT